jgi:hypothetical protein
MNIPVVHRSSVSVSRALLSGILLLLMFSARPVAAESAFCDNDIDDVVIESSEEVGSANTHRMQLADFNGIIAEIPAREESWVRDPVRVVLEYLGSPGARSVSIRRCDAPGEASTETHVTLVEDGYADDSLRGTWYHFMLERDDAGHWLIKEGREAYRCWRGGRTDSYSERICP